MKSDKKLKQLIDEINKYSSFNIREDNKQAKTAIVDFFKQFVKLDPHNKYSTARIGNNYSYMLNLLPMRQSLLDKNYNRVCHELITLNHYEDILQKRIFYNVIYLYNTQKNGVIATAEDFRIAAIFELAKKRYMLNND